MQKLKKCFKCGDLKVIWKNHEGNRYCKNCWCAINVKQSNLTSKVKKRLPSRSLKRKVQDVEYSKLRKQFLLDYPMCQAHLPGCLQVSSEVHHKKGRGKYYLDVSTWIALCHNCHVFIELHPDFAKEHNYSQKRL